MKLNSFERLAVELSKLINRTNDYCERHIENGQPYGACTINPKCASVPPPTQSIRNELEKRATDHFKQTNAVGYYLRYWTPPMLPVIHNDQAPKTISADDYQMTLGIPSFDDQWVQTTMARALIYCSLDKEQHEWSEWFELQLEAIRFTPLLFQTLNEIKTKAAITITLALPGIPIFESFIYEYAINDSHFPEMSKRDKEAWKGKKVDWKDRYRHAVDVIKSATTLQDLYIILRKRAASTRNPMLKTLFNKFVEGVEQNLIEKTALPAEVKLSLLLQLKQGKQKTSKVKSLPKRPSLCISDVECGQVLYLLIDDFLHRRKKNKALAETILFIWIAQHAAFSGLSVSEKDIFNILVSDVDHKGLTIQIANKEAYITGGLNEVLIAWIGESQRKNKRRLFHALNYDVLEDMIGNCTTKFYGKEGKLHPRDFLEKVHVAAGTRITLELRRQISRQEELIKDSPYRINECEIKKHIKESIQNKQLQKAS